MNIKKADNGLSKEQWKQEFINILRKWFAKKF